MLASAKDNGKHCGDMDLRLLAAIPANSDLFRPGVTTRSRTAFRFDVGHHSDLKPVTLAG